MVFFSSQQQQPKARNRACGCRRRHPPAGQQGTIARARAACLARSALFKLLPQPLALLKVETDGTASVRGAYQCLHRRNRLTPPASHSRSPLTPRARSPAGSPPPATRCSPMLSQWRAHHGPRPALPCRPNATKDDAHIDRRLCADRALRAQSPTAAVPLSAIWPAPPSRPPQLLLSPFSPLRLLWPLLPQCPD